MSNDCTKSIWKSVADGARWLDQRCPVWHQHIDTVELDLNYPSVCILGQLGNQQLTPRFWELCRTLRCEDVGGLLAEYGFTRPDIESDEEEDICWTTLNEAWRKEIQKRRSADGECA